MVSRAVARRGLTALAALDVLVVAAIGARYGTDGPLSTIAALVLAPVAVATVWTVAHRLAGERFALGAAAVYVALPALALLLPLASYRSAFAHGALPDLVGLRATPWFVLGIAVTLLALVPYAGVPLAVAGIVLVAVSWSELGDVRIGLHETAWSITMLEWLFVAGVAGAMRRSWQVGAALGGAVACAAALGARNGYDGTAFWQTLSAAAPAAAVLLSSVWLLVPPLRLAPRPATER